MNRIPIVALLIGLVLLVSPGFAAPGVASYPPAALGGQYGTFITGPNREPEAVSRAHPMPVEMIGSGSTSAGGGYVASLSYGLYDQFIATISTTVPTDLADLASAVPAPFWYIVRNTGAQKIHQDKRGRTPTDLCDYIAAGEQAGPFFVATGTPSHLFKSNAAGTSTVAIPIWR